MTLRLAAAEMTSELDEQRERADDGRGVEDGDKFGRFLRRRGSMEEVL